MARYQKKMNRVQPKLEESKKRFANDPQKQREAQAKIQPMIDKYTALEEELKVTAFYQRLDPQRKAVEIANRAMYCLEAENRIRAEIEDGQSTLAQVVDLYKWEKK